MSLPTFTFEVGFGATPLLASPAFTDLASDLETLTVSRGRQSDDDSAQTGTCQGTLVDDTRKYDPNNAAGAYYPNVQPMLPVRVLATLDGTTYSVFYGWVDVQNGWVRVETEAGFATVLVPCNDGFEILNAGRIFTRTLTLDYADAINFYGPSLYWRLGEPSGATAADASGNGNAGTYGAGVTLAQAGALAGGGDPDTAVALNNGATGLIQSTFFGFTHILPVNSTRTFAGWAWRNATTDADTLIGNSSASAVGIGLFCASGSEDVTWQVNVGGVAKTCTWAAAWPGTGAWHHWALTYDPTAGSAELFINGVSKGTRAIQATSGSYGAGTFVAGATVVSSTTVSNPWNGKIDEVSVFPYVLSAAQVSAIYAARLVYPTATPATPGAALTQELTGARVNDILGTGDAGSPGIGTVPQWPAAWRSLDAGNALMQAVAQADDVSSTPLQMIRDAETTEPGFFYFDGRGYACFRDRRSRPLAASQATFCDTHNLSGGRILFDSATTRRSAVVNDARATRLGGTLQEATDTASQGKLLTRSKDYSTQHLDDARALEYAQWVVNQKKDSLEVIESLTLRPGTDSPTWLQILSRELNDRITVVRTPPGGGAAVTEDYFIDSLTINWGPGPDASCTWRLSRADQTNYWLAGVAGSSEAGTTTRAAY